MIFQQQTFRGVRVELDFNRYEKCVFQACQIVYRGYSDPDFYECRFENCDYTFEGPAASMIAFLKSMHGSPAQEVAEKVIEHIRGGGAEAAAVVRGITH